MKVGELCDRLGVPYRHARYVLEQGILPPKVEEKPGRGEHRDLEPAQAFWLGIVLLLKNSGIRTPLAGKIADFTRQALRGVTQNENWEWSFEPFLGRLKTENQWFIDIGDLKYVRLATTANPSIDGLFEFRWSEIGNPKRVNIDRPEVIKESITPIVIIRVDLAQIASFLDG
jgi:hypothetical protein